MVSDTKLPRWPKRECTLCTPLEFCSLDCEAEYEHARADYWEAVARKAVEALEHAEDGLNRCYDVTDWPANGTSTQAKALAKVREALSTIGPLPPEEKT